ncbi:calcium-binding and coiled-coil domain-containing protein 2 [Salmo salar]|uniref:Calcium-binding and coiled-coil domain-containing protein 2 n=1 Tax=Salmo salar TaxID=8030 RepID=A0A1S3SL72_SALSA|nr:calcium-binding and coiled-coil domain-containing protein 2-like [Salmo salar]|eukprot:XP_014065087.1 PREDICTED: calcium-binding and coiled-coil domain-containing protein 2-like isoform X1 [Salmo salar]
MEIEQLKEQHETLRSVLKEQQQEIDRLKSLTTIPEKYERALIKIQQLKKEQEELKGKVEVQSVEIAQMTPRLKSEQETRRLKDYIQLLQEARTQLHQEQQASDNTRRRAEKAERELEEVYERMESTSMTSAQTRQKSSKLEMQLLELRRIIEEKENIAEMAKVENEELSRENQDLRRDIERLRKEFTDLQAASVSMEHPSPYGSPTDPTPTEEQQLDVLSACLPSGNHYETQDTAPNSEEEELSLQCRHCHEWFPGITQDELELHEDSHRLCPYCNLICDGVEQTIFEDHVFSHEEFTDLQAASVSMEHPSPYGSPTDPTPTEEQQLDVLSACLPSGNHYETSETAPNSEKEELSLQCRHCHEWFPGITQDELELHEDSHRLCPFCTLICDGVEQTIFEDHVFSHEV